MNIKILILENNPDIYNNYKSEFKQYTRANKSITFIPFIADTLDKARKFIEENKLDLAIIDLNLDHTKGSDNSEGNEAIVALREHFRLPIYVITGEPEKIDEDEKKYVNFYIKGDQDTSDIIEHMAEAHHSFNMNFFSRDGSLEKQINDFYWNHLSHTLSSWETVAEENGDDIDKILSRHTVSCLNEQLYVDGNRGKFDEYHPAEMYIMPPIKKHYHTGDIIEKDNKKFIILNPACDIVNKNKMDYYIIVGIIEAIT
ncbi:MAG TPA: response regulator, partial [Bacteroidia bacterium]|nr:response regulator [Bacteroidia bacterium]